MLENKEEEEEDDEKKMISIIEIELTITKI